MKVMKGLVLASLPLVPLTLSAAITGQWNFNDSAAPLAAQIGQPLQYLDGPSGETSAQTSVGTTTALGIPGINGATATVMRFGTNGFNKGYLVTHGISANGAGSMVNNWSVIMDVLFPQSSTGKWRALIQTNPDNPENEDAEIYINEGNAVGILQSYQGNVPANTWVRIAIVADLGAETPVIKKYINGTKVGEHRGAAFGLDGRFALTPDATFALFTDGYSTDVYTQPGYINSLQVHDEAISDAYVATLGGPSAAGIPTQVQTLPFVKSVSPSAGPGASPEKKYAAAIENALSHVNTNSIRLKLNGADVTPVLAATTNGATVSFSEAGLLAPGSTNEWQLVFSDDSTPAKFVTNTVQFVVYPYKAIDLPKPLYFQDFNTVAEGSLPTGWTNLSFTEITNPEEDLGNLDSATYARWTVLNADRFRGSFVTYSDPNNPQDWEDDYHRVLDYAPAFVMNGQLVTNFVQGRFAFGNSGYRNGASQVLDLYSPDFDLTGKTNVHLVFNSIWEQNQDSIAGVEYSTDRGQTWKPVIYMIDRNDVVGTNGIIDAVATLTAEHTDVARYTDENGQELGGTYGAFVKAPVDASLAPFISGRIDDDPRDSKRIEMFRLPETDNKSTVRFRFFHAGTDSWYFGIDNFGLYEIASLAGPEIRLNIVRSGNNVTIQWVGNGQLQKTTTLNNPNWQTVPANPPGNTNIVDAMSGQAAFYRVQR
jgi:hypothetical protein